MKQVKHCRTGYVNGIEFQAWCTGSELVDADINSYTLEYSDIEVEMISDEGTIAYDFYVKDADGELITLDAFIKKNIFNYEIEG